MDSKGRRGVIFHGRAVEHPQIPEDPEQNFVRSELVFGCTLLEESETQPGKCHITSITEFDPKGWIASSIVNWAAKSLPNEFYTGVLKAKDLRVKDSLKPHDFVNYYRLCDCNNCGTL